MISSTRDGCASDRCIDALLILVAYHPGEEEVQRLLTSVQNLSATIGYAVVVNHHQPGEPVESLADGAYLFVRNRDNKGYGRAINQVVRLLSQRGPIPPYLGALNTDLSWDPGSFEALILWMNNNPEVSLACPHLYDLMGREQQLCKQHPTLLGLFSRRFIPERCKPAWLRRYDRWYVMADQDYSNVFDVPYLSGCCMLFRTDAFKEINGFDEHFFLYLEDADITRAMAREGRTVHLPVASVTHDWGRGNYRSKRLTLVNFHSAWIYFRKWGLRLW